MSSNSGIGALGCDSCRDSSETCASRLRMMSGSTPVIFALELSSRAEMSSSRASRWAMVLSEAAAGARLSSRCARSSKRASMAFMMPALLRLDSEPRSSSRAATSSSRRSRSRNTAWPCSMRVALAAVEQVGEHVETLLDALEDVVGVGRGRRLVELVGNHRDLRCQALDGLVGQLAARRDFVDALRKQVEPVDHFAARAILDQFLDLMGERGDPRLDPLERLRVEMLRRHGGGRRHDRARDLVEPLFDHLERRIAGAVLLPREMVDRAGQRAHLLFERTQRQRFRQVVDGGVDLLEPRRQRLDRRIGCTLARLRIEAILEFAEADGRNRPSAGRPSAPFPRAPANRARRAPAPARGEAA